MLKGYEFSPPFLSQQKKVVSKCRSATRSGFFPFCIMNEHHCKNKNEDILSHTNLTNRRDFTYDKTKYTLKLLIKTKPEGE